jgi:hypothetical protein
MTKGSFTKASVACFFLFCASTKIMARERPTSPPGNSGNTPAVDHASPESPVGAPFDGGLTILLAAGIGASLKKGYDKRKKAGAV